MYVIIVEQYYELGGADLGTYVEKVVGPFPSAERAQQAMREFREKSREYIFTITQLQPEI